MRLIRHAKSSWADPLLADWDRPLNKRGKRACKLMAPAIWQAGCRFEHVFCSPAVRAQSTMEGIAAALPERNLTWQIDETLYTFDMRSLLTWCRALPDSLADAVVVGHNPALSALCDYLAAGGAEEMPTCAYVCLCCPQDSWSALQAKSATIQHWLVPKALRAEH